jgi:hypothetical protein
MGQLNNKILGDSSGRVGNIVFRERGDQVYISKRPRKNKNRIVSDLAKAVREKFGLTVAVCKEINAADLLKSGWTADPANAKSKFNKIFQANYKAIGTVDAPGKPILLPSTGFPIENGVITLTQTGFTVSAEAPGAGSGVNPTLEKDIIGVGVVIMTNPTDVTLPKFKVAKVMTGMQSLDTDAPINLSYAFTGDPLSEFGLYTTKQVSLTLITVDNLGHRINNSVTFKNA